MFCFKFFIKIPYLSSKCMYFCQNFMLSNFKISAFRLYFLFFLQNLCIFIRISSLNYRIIYKVTNIHSKFHSILHNNRFSVTKNKRNEIPCQMSKENSPWSKDFQQDPCGICACANRNNKTLTLSSMVLYHSSYLSDSVTSQKAQANSVRFLAYLKVDWVLILWYFFVNFESLNF